MKYTNKLKPTTRADSAQMLRMLNGSGVVQRTTTQRDTIRINFTAQGIGTADSHLEELEAIRSSGPEDLIVVYFTDCPGGAMGTGQSLINALMETPAHTVAVLEGHNCSLATMIPLICREIIVTPYTSMMLHSVSGGSYGTMVNQERQAMFFSKLYSDFIEDVYDWFLSPEEIQDLKNGLEIYLNSEEIEERLQRRAELIAAESEEEECSGSAGRRGCEGCSGTCEVDEDEAEEEEQEAPAPTRLKGVLHQTEVVAKVEPPPVKKPSKKKAAKA